jgi:putative transposase
MGAATRLAPDVGMRRACATVGVNRSSVYRHDARHRHLARSPLTPVRRPSSPLAFDDTEREAVRAVLCSERFRDCAPPTIYATLLDEGIYVGSVRTMYRRLADNSQTRERRNQRAHPLYAKPELLATRANEVWSWDITKLKGPAKWTCFHLYVILDIFSRYVIGWMIAPEETAELAEHLIADTVAKQLIEPGTLTLHADRGASMRSKPVAALLVDLDVAKSHSRPYVSDDNPYSEAQFKTLKYRPDFPERFGCIEDARAHCRSFFNWYNTEHRHSGIGYMTPEAMHYGLADTMQRQRAVTLEAAYLAHPNRFKGNVPRPPTLPVAAWINQPKQETADKNTSHSSTLIKSTPVSQCH